MTVGFVGAGLMGWAHAIGVQALIKAGHVEAAVGAVFDVDADRASALAAANDAPAVSSIAEVLDRCDAVWVCTPTVAHRSAVEAALKRGRAIFCEKPLATDHAGARSMAEAVRSSAVTAQVGLVLRFSPAVRTLERRLASGELGEPMTVVLRDDQYFPVQGIYGSAWRVDVTMSGGGCLIEHSIHDVDVLRVLLGDVVQVAARTSSFAGRPGIEDLAVVTMQFASGASAELVSIWHDILSRGSTRRIEVFCRRGLVWLENEYLGPLHVQTSERSEVVECSWPDWVAALEVGEGDVGLAIRSYVEADRAFIDAASRGEAATPSFAEALVDHGIVDAAYRSAAAAGVPIAL